MTLNSKIVDHIREVFGTKDFIPLHAPVFPGNEKKYLAECIDTTFVSYVGAFVSRFEELTQQYTGAKYAVATTSGTAALHVALDLVGVGEGDEVLAQSLTFVASINAIRYCGADPVFVDVEKETMGMSPESLKKFLEQYGEIKEGVCYNKKSGKKIKACIPMHTFGHPVKIDEIVAICDPFGIPVVEDSAESLGSFYKGRHTGTFGKVGILSYNGNKTVTTGGGGMIITNDEDLARRAKHITTTAKVPHKWEFFHDMLGYNYRLPNINAAVGCAQMENLEMFLGRKRALASSYKNFFKTIGVSFFTEPSEANSNYWLNAVVFNDKKEREEFLEYSNSLGVMTRPIWTLMNKLPMYQDCLAFNLENSNWLEERVVNIPSSVIL